MAISIILDIKSSEAKRSLPSVVLAAILVNFSMFFVKVIIDVGNIVAVQFYNAITDDGFHSFSEQIMSGFSLHAFIAGAIDSAGEPLFSGEWGAPIFVELLQFLMFIIALFIFVAIAIIFIVRSVMLVFLLILSPIGIIGSAIPFLQSYGQRFWKHLSKNILSAPVFLIFAYIILSLSRSGELIGGTDDLTIGIFFFNFAILSGLWIAAVKITFSLSESFGMSLSKAAVGLTGGAAGFALGKAGMLGRQVIGRGGAMIARDESLQKAASEGNQLVIKRTRSGKEYTVNTAPLARGFLATGKYLSKASFDPRTMGAGDALNKGLGVVGLSTDLGSGYKGGFEKAKGEKAKKLTETAELYSGKNPERMRAMASEYEKKGLTIESKDSAKNILRGAKKEEVANADVISVATKIEKGLREGIETGATDIGKVLEKATNKHLKHIDSDLMARSEVLKHLTAGNLQVVKENLTNKQKEDVREFYRTFSPPSGSSPEEIEKFTRAKKLVEGPDSDF